MLETIKNGTLEYLVAPGISTPHAFTTRYGGVSTGVNDSLNLALNDRDTLENVKENIHILAWELGFQPGRLVMTRQTHSDIIRVVTDADASGLCHRDYPECDGLCTNTPGVSLLVFTADCTPILLSDPVTGAVGAVHAGWRGTAANIAVKCARTMCENFGCQMEDIHAAIGPNIGPCHFETDADVPDAMLAAFGGGISPCIERKGEKFFLDLKAINAYALEQAGVRHIDVSSNCTYCEHDRFWSHRYTKGARGSQGAIIVCKEDCL